MESKDYYQSTEIKNDNYNLNYYAIIIQKVYKGYKSRRDILKYHKAATRIQSHFRGYLQRRYSLKQRTIRNSLKHVNMKMDFTQRHIVYLEQEMMELSVANRSRIGIWESQRRDRAARKIQACIRGFLARKSYKSRSYIPLTETHDIQPQDIRNLNMNYWESKDEESDVLEQVISSAIKRIQKDTINHANFKDLMGFNQNSVLREDLNTQNSSATDTIIFKLETVERLLDEYYGKDEETNNTQSDHIIQCKNLKTKVDQYIDIIENAFNETADIIKMPRDARKFHIQSVMNAKRNWWDLLKVYSNDEASSDAVLDSLVDMIDSEDIQRVY